jgi:phosphoribosylformylglycinamidine cyclo-ligase
MHRTFNCGIGMVAIVPADQAQRSLQLLVSLGERATIIGEIRAGTSGVVIGNE